MKIKIAVMKSFHDEVIVIFFYRKINFAVTTNFFSGWTSRERAKGGGFYWPFLKSEKDFCDFWNKNALAVFISSWNFLFKTLFVSTQKCFYDVDVYQMLFIWESFFTKKLSWLHPWTYIFSLHTYQIRNVN